MFIVASFINGQNVQHRRGHHAGRHGGGIFNTVQHCSPSVCIIGETVFIGASTDGNTTAGPMLAGYSTLCMFVDVTIRRCARRCLRIVVAAGLGPVDAGEQSAQRRCHNCCSTAGEHSAQRRCHTSSTERSTLRRAVLPHAQRRALCAEQSFLTHG